MKESITYRGRKIKIEQDQDVESPDSWGDDSLFIVANHNQFFVQEPGEKSRRIDFDELVERYRKTHWIFPLHAYIHSGVALSLTRDQYPFNDRWDSGQVGFVFASKKEWRLSKSAFKCAEGHVETWNQYLSGDVYGYIVGDDSCWGFYGYDYCLQEAKSIVDYQIKAELSAKLKRLKEFIKNKVDLAVRWAEFQPEEREA